jgi:hypothetical protein
MRRHGNPLAGGTANGEPLSYLNEVVMNYSGDECLAWPYNRNSAGYGMVNEDGKYHIASRLVCERVNGPPPETNYDSAHSCGNGHLGCVTKKHLSWKTRAENMADKVEHGTHHRGERSNTAKLTQANIIEIRSLQGVKTQTEIAAQFGISRAYVSEIHNRRKWAHLR